MSLLENLSDAYESTMTSAFGYAPQRQVNERLAFNVFLFGSATVLYELYGHLFEV